MQQCCCVGKIGDNFDTGHQRASRTCENQRCVGTFKE